MPRKKTVKPPTIEELKTRHKAYMLRTCNADMTSHGGFQWPTFGTVECPDWKPKAECGNGLHGLLWGAGSANYLSWDPDAKWMVVGIDEWVDIDGKIKAPRADVVHVGDKASCAALLISLGADPATCIGSTLTGGDGSTLTGGDGSTLTGGYGSTLTGGYGSTLTGGYGSTLTGGDGSTLTGGYDSTLTGGYGSTLICQYWDEKREQWRIRMAEVGEDGVLAGVAYRLSGDKFVPVKDGATA